MTQSLQVAGVSQRLDHAWQICKVWSFSFFKILQTTCLKVRGAQGMLRNTTTQNWGQKDIGFECRCNKLSYLSHFLSILAFINVDALCWGLWSLVCYPVSPADAPCLHQWFLPPVAEASSLAVFLWTSQYTGNLSGWVSSLSQKSVCLLLVNIINNYNDPAEGH